MFCTLFKTYKIYDLLLKKLVLEATFFLTHFWICMQQKAVFKTVFRIYFYKRKCRRYFFSENVIFRKKGADGSNFRALWSLFFSLETLDSKTHLHQISSKMNYMEKFYIRAVGPQMVLMSIKYPLLKRVKSKTTF